MRYEPPRFMVHGSIESLTEILDGGSDQCNKQVGLSDLINGQIISLGTCTASSA